MKIPQGVCQCNSGKQAVDCCYQIRPPIDQDMPIRISSFNNSAFVQLVDVLGRRVSKKFPIQTKVRIKASNIFEPDDFIYKLVKSARGDINLRLSKSFNDPDSKKNIEYEYTLFDNLYRNIRGTYYHLQNFIFRLIRMTNMFDKNPVSVGRDISIIEEDWPLEYEFESFMVRYRTCVELSVKLIAHKTTKYDPRTDVKFFSKTIKYIQLHADTPTRKMLSEVIMHHNDWLLKQRDIRSDIVHDGVNKVLVKFEHVRGATLNATVMDRIANYKATEMFNELIEFLDSVIKAIYSTTETETRVKRHHRK